jgi:hypothetical protein
MHIVKKLNSNYKNKIKYLSLLSSFTSQNSDICKNHRKCIPRLTYPKVIPFGGQYAMNLGVHIEGLSNVKEEIS